MLQWPVCVWLLQIVKIVRDGLGRSNLAKKTLVDKRFLIWFVQSRFSRLISAFISYECYVRGSFIGWWLADLLYQIVASKLTCKFIDKPHM